MVIRQIERQSAWIGSVLLSPEIRIDRWAKKDKGRGRGGVGFLMAIFKISHSLINAVELKA